MEQTLQYLHYEEMMALLLIYCRRRLTYYHHHLTYKQNDKILNLPNGYPEPILNSFAFRSSELKNLLLDFDQSGGLTPNGLFHLVIIKIADILAPKLAVVFHILIRQGSFPVC